MESVGRGALQGATFGFADEIAGALGAAFGDKTYQQARDESRAKFKAAEDENPKAYMAGDLGGGLATAFVPGLGEVGAAEKVGEGASLGAQVAKGIESGAKFGAVQGLGSSNADLTQGDFKGAIADTVKGAAVGGVAGGILEPLAGTITRAAPERLAKDVLTGITAGDGEFGGATMTAKKMVARDKKDILDTVMADPELLAVVDKPAAEALPVVKAKLIETGAKLDPFYDQVDKETGGVNLGDFVRHLDDAKADYAKSPLNEMYGKAIDDIKHSALKAWDPQLLEALSTEEAANPKVYDFLLDKLAVSVPTKDIRQLVTRLQTRGSQVINPLNPGEATLMKGELASMTKKFLDSHLDAAAFDNPKMTAVVKGIREVNTTYSALSNIKKAIDQRGEKEATGSMSLGSHFGGLVHGGGLLGAGMMLLHGNIPGAIQMGLLSQFGPGLAKTMTAKGNLALANLVRSAQQGKLSARVMQQAIEAGVPRAVILKAVSLVNSATQQALAQ